MNIILIGFMGCGKSTIGVRLSYKMKQPFIDTDKYIEKMQSKTISEIFAEQGEEAFRRIETQTISDMISQPVKDHVIATGGGMPVRPENRELLKRLGIVVWLRVRPDTVVERLKDDTTRPLLQTEDPEGRIKELMDARAEAYLSCSDIIVDVDGKPVERIMDEIFTRANGIWKKKKRTVVR